MKIAQSTVTLSLALLVNMALFAQTNKPATAPNPNQPQQAQGGKPARGADLLAEVKISATPYVDGKFSIRFVMKNGGTQAAEFKEPLVVSAYFSRDEQIGDTDKLAVSQTLRQTHLDVDKTIEGDLEAKIDMPYQEFIRHYPNLIFVCDAKKTLTETNEENNFTVVKMPTLDGNNRTSAQTFIPKPPPVKTPKD